jgi:molybdenum cofactor biosynthesis protein B
LLTVSTSRYAKLANKTPFSDESTDSASELIRSGGHIIKSTKVVDDQIGLIRLELLKAIYEEAADVVVLIGGTGLSSRDVTVEAVKPLLNKELDGFPEIFRVNSFREIGTAAYLTRTIAGSIEGRLVFCLPGSPDAVTSALKLIIPELQHAAYIART